MTFIEGCPHCTLLISEGHQLVGPKCLYAISLLCILYCSYSHRKGHYCLLVEGKQKCLGPSKGRQYPPLRDAELSYLLDYYSQENAKLITLLRDLKRPIPIWLADR